MNFSAQLKLTIKLVRREGRRLRAAMRHGSLAESPVLFANSFPKSGTHLLTQVLEGFARVAPVALSGLPAVVMFDGPTGRPRPLNAILRDLDRFRPGDVGYGHLHALPPIVERLCAPGRAAFFIYRDPRDVVVSHVHYVTEMEPNHVHHAYYRSLPDFESRLRTSILGRPDLDVPFPDIRARFEPYLGWLERPEVLALRFEDFITHREETLLRVVEHAQVRGLRLPLGVEATLRALNSAIDPRRSPTFRSGKIGKWREAFTPEIEALFNDVAGDLVERLGYG